MKIEFEIKDELVKRFGEEAIRIYLTNKAEKLEESLHQSSGHMSNPETDTASDEETLKNSWAKFNKRGMSC